jgi:hypothetical protein
VQDRVGGLVVGSDFGQAAGGDLARPRGVGQDGAAEGDQVELAALDQLDERGEGQAGLPRLVGGAAERGRDADRADRDDRQAGPVLTGESRGVTSASSSSVRQRERGSAAVFSSVTPSAAPQSEALFQWEKAACVNHHWSVACRFSTTCCGD